MPIFLERACNKVNRQEIGSMLVLSCLIGVLIIVGTVFIYDVLSAYINHQLLSDRADRLALEAASKFNQGDRANRMNHLLVQSRDLIFHSRQTYDKTLSNQPYKHLLPLADQLLKQSRQGATLLEQERQRLVAVRLAEVQQSLSNQGFDSSGPALFSKLSVEGLDVGTIDGFTSGVPSSYSSSELREDDLEKRLIDKKTGIYFGEIDAKLPSEDRDLPFKLCSLPPLNKQGALQRSAPYRQYAILRKNGEEIPFQCGQMPTVVRLHLLGKYRGIFSKQQYELAADAMATSAGPAFK